MTTRVQAPDGSVIEFPDGMSDDDIGSVMRKQFGGPEPQKTDPTETKAQALADQLEASGGKSGAGSLFKNAFSFGLQDKVSGLVHGMGAPFTDETFGERYNVGRRAQEIIEERARERSGSAGTAAEIGGTLGTGVVARAPAAATWALRALQTGREGAALGGLQGAGDAGGSPGEIVGGALTGAAVGGGAGMGLSSALDAGAAAYRGLRNTGRAIGRMNDAPEGRAVRMVNEALSNDAISPQQAAARMRRSQADPNAPNLTLMDVADQNTLGLAAAASSSPGQGRQISNSYLDRRAQGQPGRTMAAASDALGDPNTFRQTGQQLARQRASHGDALYNAAWQTARPVDVEQIIHRLDGRIPSAKGGIQNTLQRVRGLLVRRGTMGEMAERDLRSLHEVKMELDNMLTAGGDSSMGRVARGEVARVRRELLNAMDQSSPAYRAARSVYADESAQMNALELGRRFLREDVDDLADQMATMGAAERQMFQQGAVREVRHIIESAPDGADTVKRVFGSPEKRAALRSVFQNDRDFRRFTATMLREASARRTRDIVHVRRGSRTEVLRGDNEAASGANEVIGAGIDIATGMATGGLAGGSAVNRTAQAFSRMLQARNRMSPEVAAEVARIMVNENPAEVMRLLSMGPQAAQAIPASPRMQALRRGASITAPQMLMHEASR